MTNNQHRDLLEESRLKSIKPEEIDLKINRLLDKYTTYEEFLLEKRYLLYDTFDDIGPDEATKFHDLDSLQINDAYFFNRFDFVYCSSDKGRFLQNFEEGFKNGFNFFQHNFCYTQPNERDIRFLSGKYNSEWKCTKKRVFAFFHFAQNVEKHGFDSGLLKAYIDYEKIHISRFKQLETQAPITFKKERQPRAVKSLDSYFKTDLVFHRREDFKRQLMKLYDRQQYSRLGDHIHKLQEEGFILEGFKLKPFLQALSSNSLTPSQYVQIHSYYKDYK